MYDTLCSDWVTRIICHVFRLPSFTGLVKIFLHGVLETPPAIYATSMTHDLVSSL